MVNRKKYIDKQIQIDRHRCIQMEKQKYIHIDGEIDKNRQRLTNRQKHTQTDRDRQIDTQMELDKYTEIDTGTNTDKQK